jgi:hypothetical protein
MSNNWFVSSQLKVTTNKYFNGRIQLLQESCRISVDTAHTARPLFPYIFILSNNAWTSLTTVARALFVCFFGQRPLRSLGPPSRPSIIFLSTTQLTEMTGISLLMQWPLTSQSHGKFYQREQLFFSLPYGSNSTLHTSTCICLYFEWHNPVRESGMPLRWDYLGCFGSYLQHYSLAGFDLTTHFSSLPGGNQRRYYQCILPELT